MPDISLDIVEWVAASQLLIIVIFGFFYSTFVWLRHRNSPYLRLFKQGDYISGIIDDPNVIFESPPKWFRFVIVQYETDGQVSSESFYTILGDVIEIKFSEGQYSGMEGYPYSNTVFVVVGITSVGLIFLSSFLTSPGLAPLVGDQSVIAQQLAQVGRVLFFSVFLSAPIKMIFDFANYANFSIK
ncbi:MAG: hypothetical protein ACTS2F_11685 [Thainema sp.]